MWSGSQLSIFRAEAAAHHRNAAARIDGAAHLHGSGPARPRIRPEDPVNGELLFILIHDQVADTWREQDERAIRACRELESCAMILRVWVGCKPEIRQIRLR